MIFQWLKDRETYLLHIILIRLVPLLDLSETQNSPPMDMDTIEQRIQHYRQSIFVGLSNKAEHGNNLQHSVLTKRHEISRNRFSQNNTSPHVWV